MNQDEIERWIGGACGQSRELAKRLGNYREVKPFVSPRLEQIEAVRARGDVLVFVRALDRSRIVVALNLGPEVPDGSPVRIQPEVRREGR